jgi:hypothetical protein
VGRSPEYASHPLCYTPPNVTVPQIIIDENIFPKEIYLFVFHNIIFAYITNLQPNDDHNEGSHIIYQHDKKMSSYIDFSIRKILQCLQLFAFAYVSSLPSIK